MRPVRFLYNEKEDKDELFCFFIKESTLFLFYLQPNYQFVTGYYDYFLSFYCLYVHLLLINYNFILS